MRFLRDRRTNPHEGRAESARRPLREKRFRTEVETLECRRLLSTLDINGGALNYLESYSGTTNQLSIVSTGPAPPGTYTIVDQVETIQIRASTTSLGSFNVAAHSARGPGTSAQTIAKVAANQDSNVAGGSIDTPTTVTGFKAVLAGGVPGA